MKLTRKLKLRIIIGIAIIFIVYGILDYLFKFNVDEKVVSNVGMVLMIAAFGLLFSRGDQADTKQPDNQQGNPETNPESDESQIEQTALENDMVKDQDKGATNNDDTRNDIRSGS